MWGLPPVFSDVSSRRNPRSKVPIKYEGKLYEGWVTTTKQGRRRSSVIRFWFEEDLSVRLQFVFLMSYMRSLEQKLAGDSGSEIEEEIPFLEFLDIEFNPQDRQFTFVAYYKQKPSFPNLFKRLVGSPGLKRVADAIEGKKETRIYKQDWKARNQLPYEIGATNVLYYLVDTQQELLYVGEAKNLVTRLSQNRPSMS